jgi:DNA-binding NarL/FixJ family response regulator
MKIKILIVDDHQLFREGIVTLLFSAENIEVIAQAVDGLDAIDKAKHYKPDVVLLDIAMQYVKGVLEAGADGYLLKNCTYRQLTEAIHTVYDGKKYLSEDITEMVINGYLEPSGSDKSDFEKLSNREKDVFHLFSEGKSTREIGELLFVSVKTVNTHKQNLLEKLELKSNTDLIKYALKNGFISLE